MSKLETNTIDTVSGTSNLTIGSTNSSTVTFESGAATGHMYPAFQAKLSVSQNISDSVTTKVQFDTEIFDTDNCYDNSTNFRFLPTVAGKYFVFSFIEGDGTGTNKTERVQLLIYKNGVLDSLMQNYPNTAAESNNVGLAINSVCDMNGSTDYIEIFAYVDALSVQATVIGAASHLRSTFGAYRIGS
jgi:hypothetical protein